MVFRKPKSISAFRELSFTGLRILWRPVRKHKNRPNKIHLHQEKVKAMEENTSKTRIWCNCSSSNSCRKSSRSRRTTTNIRAAFEQFSCAKSQQFFLLKNIPWKKIDARLYLSQFFTKSENVLLYDFFTGQIRQVLSSDELAALFHFPNAQYNKMPNLKWKPLNYPAPHNLPGRRIAPLATTPTARKNEKFA